MEERISQSYHSLSDKLRLAADFVAEHPLDVATRSLRSVAQASGVSPATFSRLARALGYADYEEMREAGRRAMGARIVPFEKRAEALRKGDQSAASVLHRIAGQSAQNIDYLVKTLSPERLDAVVDVLYHAEKVLLIGQLASAGIVDFFAYQAQYFARNWSVAGRAGGSVAARFAQMGPRDAVIVLTKTPYARESLKPLKLARENGFHTIVMTDSHASPALEFADHSFVLPTETANFFSSYGAVLVLMETMLAMLVARLGEEAEARIRETTDQTHRLNQSSID